MRLRVRVAYMERIDALSRKLPYLTLMGKLSRGEFKAPRRPLIDLWVWLSMQKISHGFFVCRYSEAVVICVPIAWFWPRKCRKNANKSVIRSFCFFFTLIVMCDSVRIVKAYDFGVLNIVIGFWMYSHSPPSTRSRKIVWKVSVSLNVDNFHFFIDGLLVIWRGWLYYIIS